MFKYEYTTPIWLTDSALIPVHNLIIPSVSMVSTWDNTSGLFKKRINTFPRVGANLNLILLDKKLLLVPLIENLEKLQNK